MCFVVKLFADYKIVLLIVVGVIDNVVCCFMCKYLWSICLPN